MSSTSEGRWGTFANVAKGEVSEQKGAVMVKIFKSKQILENFGNHTGHEVITQRS